MVAAGLEAETEAGRVLSTAAGTYLSRNHILRPQPLPLAVKGPSSFRLGNDVIKTVSIRIHD